MAVAIDIPAWPDLGRIRLAEIGERVAAVLAEERGSSAAHPAAFERWMAREQRRVYVLCLRLLRNTHEADSATQDAFLKAHQVLFQPGGSTIEAPEKWLTRVAVNLCMDRLRSRRWAFWHRSRALAEEQAILQLVPASGPGPDDLLRAREIARRLTAALSRLSSRQRSVFILRHEEDLGLEEIASILRLDLGTVKSHMARALKKLREELRDLYGSPALD